MSRRTDLGGDHPHSAARVNLRDASHSLLRLASPLFAQLKVLWSIERLYFSPISFQITSQAVSIAALLLDHQLNLLSTAKSNWPKEIKQA